MGVCFTENMEIFNALKKKGKEYFKEQVEQFKDEQKFRKELNKKLIEARRKEQEKELIAQIKKRAKERIRERFSKKKDSSNILTKNLLPRIEEPKVKEIDPTKKKRGAYG